jgi:hypothetical protein
MVNVSVLGRSRITVGLPAGCFLALPKETGRSALLLRLRYIARQVQIGAGTRMFFYFLDEATGFGMKKKKAALGNALSFTIDDFPAHSHLCAKQLNKHKSALASRLRFGN